ncbi:response regulator transcription factor [Massilia sp. TWP1-3-3]|uniref:response regulator transcription factor n=1 Tax=Massilia sp. TWP1-3-3 TaxID=2804573 RepID=UPI003CF1C7C4
MSPRCLIVDDHPITLMGLRQLISQSFPAWDVASAASVQQANSLINQAHDQPFCIVILEIMLLGHTGASALMQLEQALGCRAIPCLVFSNVSDRRTVSLCKELGAVGYVSKRTHESEVVRAIDTVCNGGIHFQLDDMRRADPGGEDGIRITPRQKDILDLVFAGYSNKQIASALQLTCGTVKNYMFDLMRLLNVSSRLELGAKLRRNGYIPVSGVALGESDCRAVPVRDQSGSRAASRMI